MTEFQHPAILLVDDDFNITAGLKDILEDSGYLVEVAGSGSEAIEHMTRTLFHVMVVDYSLPDCNGIQLAKQVRGIDPTIEVLLMTGHDLLEIEGSNDTKGLYAAFLRKPVDVGMMTQAVSEAMGRQFKRLGFPWPPPPTPTVATSQPPVFSAPLPARVGTPAPLPQLTLEDPPAAKWPTWMYAAPMTLFVVMGFGAGWMLRGHITAIATSSEAVNTPVKEPVITDSGPTSAPLIAADTGFVQSTAAVVALAAPPAARAISASIVTAVVKPMHPIVRPVPHPVPAPKRAPVVKNPAPVSYTQTLDAARAVLKTTPTDEKAIETVLDSLDDRDPQQRIAAVDVVAGLGITSTEVIAELSQLLFDPDPTVSLATANALGRLGSAAIPAVPHLIEALSYKSEATSSVGNAAKEALVRLGPDAVPGLIKGLDNLNVCKDVIDVLTRLGAGASSAIPALTQLRSDPDVGLAANAAIAHIQETDAVKTSTPVAVPAETPPAISAPVAEPAKAQH